MDINMDASPQDEQVDHDRNDNQKSNVITVECVPHDDDDYDYDDNDDDDDDDD